MRDEAWYEGFQKPFKIKQQEHAEQILKLRDCIPPIPTLIVFQPVFVGLPSNPQGWYVDSDHDQKK